MQHGFTDSLETWYEAGYVEALKTERRLILVDARGHGASDKPHDPAAYTRQLQVDDIVAVLRELGVARADYFGYSMGGKIGYGLAQYARQQMRSLIIGGAGGDGAPRIGDGFLAKLRAEGIEAILTLWGAPSPAHKARLLTNDIEALKACRADQLGFSAVLRTMTMPCLVYAGDADRNYSVIESPVAEMPNVKFVTLRGYGHADAFLRSELILPQVIEFLGAVTS
jgi:pimeloyl-ACP methyl ester carboxylesterase